MTIAESKAGTQPLNGFTALLGDDAFFVPCEWGTKKPLVTYVERPFESTQSEAYQALFTVQDFNVAIYLGTSQPSDFSLVFARPIAKGRLLAHSAVHQLATSAAFS